MSHGLLARLLTIRPEEASFQARGFDLSGTDRALGRRLEVMLESFIGGYNTVVRAGSDQSLCAELYRNYDQHHVGFAFEGIGLYLTMLDLGLPGRSNRLDQFTKGAGKNHDFIIAVGAGFAVARVPWGLRSINSYLLTLDPFVGWCIPGGYGFHEGFFKHRRFIDGAEAPPRILSPEGKRIFDSGLGRAMWWVKCANPEKIAAAINGFAESRRAELWAGIGIAACYAGGVSDTALYKLNELAGSFRYDFLSGLPFGARLRQKAGNYSVWTESACGVVIGV